MRDLFLHFGLDLRASPEALSHGPRVPPPDRAYAGTLAPWRGLVRHLTGSGGSTRCSDLRRKRSSNPSANPPLVRVGEERPARGWAREDCVLVSECGAVVLAFSWCCRCCCYAPCSFDGRHMCRKERGSDARTCQSADLSFKLDGTPSRILVWKKCK